MIITNPEQMLGASFDFLTADVRAGELAGDAELTRCLVISDSVFLVLQRYATLPPGRRGFGTA